MITRTWQPTGGTLDSPIFYPQAVAAGSRLRTEDPRRLSRRPSAISFYAALVAAGVGMGLVLGLPLVDGTLSEIHLRGGLAMFLGSTTGLAGTYAALLMVVMASRAPALERTLGQDGVLRWHRRLAPWTIGLITAHAVLLTLAYAQAAHSGVWGEVGVLLRTFPNMVTATVALAIMVLIGLISIRQVRTRIPRERWWVLHLLMYVALALAFAHEVVLGPSFVRHPIAQYTWTLAWVAAALLVLTYRVGVPVYRSRRHQLRVAEVLREGPDVVSVILEGRSLDRLAIAGGQFCEWRFLTPRLWWQAHPFTVSALPQPPYLRLTVKGVGDFTRALADLAPGTRVAMEGPYGAFTVHAQRRRNAVLIAGGVGVTAVRSLLEDLPLKSRPVVVLRAASEAELVLADEVEELVRVRKGTTHRLVGNRDAVPMESIVRLIPDIAKRDVFVSGSTGFVRDAVAAVQRAGVPADALHQEVYAL